MKRTISSILLGAALCCSSSIWAEKGVKQINPQFLSDEAAKEYLISGGYYENWGEFDIMSRIKRMTTLDSIKLFAQQQVYSWDDSAKESVEESVKQMNEMIQENGYNLPLPASVPFIRTSMREEGGAAAYTRKDGIVMGYRAHYMGVELVAHELFHTLTRNNPKFKKEMYNLIGFKILKKEIEVPVSFKNKIITNPDVEHHNAYATFTINGEKKDCTMYIYSNEEWRGGSFFNYMKIGLVEIDKKKCKAILKDGEPIIHSIEDATDFYDIVGRNTGYVIDPEEILADNFSYIFYGDPSSDLGKSIQKLLKK